ncbi:MAG: hypothetical protein NT112_04320 [Methanoregula sp.]|nr:hypothetical protein [Methanoregula sp.]
MTIHANFEIRMKEWEYNPNITGRQKFTAVMVGAGLGLLLAVVNIIFRRFLEEWQFMALPVFIAGAIVILGLAYLPRM